MYCIQFHSQELEKHQKAAREAREQQQYHLSQMAEATQRERNERDSDIEYTKKNTDLLKVCSHNGDDRTGVHLTFNGRWRRSSFSSMPAVSLVKLKTGAPL